MQSSSSFFVFRQKNKEEELFWQSFPGKPQKTTQANSEGDAPRSRVVDKLQGTYYTHYTTPALLYQKKNKKKLKW